MISISSESMDQLVASNEKCRSIKELIQNDTIVVIKNVVSEELILNLRGYLGNIGLNSMPNYQPITPDAPNFHRLNNGDLRAHVNGVFQQFNFFPWNDDVFKLHDIFEKVLVLRNRINNRDDHFAINDGNDSFVSRLCFQFYPSGSGHLEKHRDPVDIHQMALPSLVMSKFGKDYTGGGVFVEVNGEKHFFEHELCIGDLTLIKANLVHGVDMVDPHYDGNGFLTYQGRWMGLFPVNKFSHVSSIDDSIALSQEQ